MIDIHCHILPGVDDGAKDIEESLEMARLAVNEGITKIINTSHYHPYFNYEKGDILLNRAKDFNNILKQNNIDLEILIGNELYYSTDLLEYIESKDFYTLNNSRYLLIEFSQSNFPKNIVDIVYELKIRGYIPILAHVERYRQVQENPNIIYECIKEGALIQINSNTILSKNSKEACKLCKILLDNNMVHFIATDAHNTNRRKPAMKGSYEYIIKKYGKYKADQLFNLNQEFVIQDKLINIESPTKYEERGFFARLFKRKYRLS